MATNKNTCPNCNADNPMDARYCRHCGFLMPNASKEGNSEQQALAKKVVDLQKQITSVTIELEKSNKTITQLGDERLKLEDCCNRYRCDCKKVEDEVRVLRAARQKAEATANKAKEEVRKAKSVRAELENSNSTKAGLLWLLVIVIVICSIVIFNINSSRNLVKSQNIRLEQQVSDLQTKTNRLSSKNKSLESTNKKLTDVVEKLGKNNPIIVSSIEVRNSGEDYGSTIYSSKTTYINPRFTAYCLISGTADINIKFFTPYGLSTGTASKKTPYGYSYADDVYLTKFETKTFELMGWGGKSKGHWDAGNYRIELYYKGRCIGTKSFTIY